MKNYKNMTELELFSALSEKIQNYYDPTQWGECNEINSTIGKFLTELGYEITCVAGYVKCDNATTIDWIYDPLHFWLLYKGNILDFASAQFKNSFIDDDLNEKLSKNYFLGKCDYYIEVSKHPIDNEWIDKEIFNELKKDMEEI